MVNRYLLFLLLIFGPAVSSAIVGGRDTTMAEIFQFQAFVSVTEDNTGGGGVHIGGGLILTAAHVVEAIHKTITIRNVAGTELASFPFDRRQSIQMPNVDGEAIDLAIIVPDSATLEIIKKLPAAQFLSSGNIKDITELKMVGIGDVDFADTRNPSGYRARIGAFKIVAQTELDSPTTFSTELNSDKNWAAAAPRDSGSPLWAILKDSKVPFVIGIVKELFIGGGRKQLRIVNIYSNMTVETIHNWVLNESAKVLQPGRCAGLF